MANAYNPNNPIAIGNEWLATVGGSQVIGPAVEVFTQRLRSTIAETIGVLRPRVVSTNSVLPLYGIIDVIPSGSEQPTPTTAVLSPNEDVSLGTLPDNVWLDASGSIVNGWDKINDVPVTLPVDADALHVRSTANAFPVVARFRLNTAAIPSTARILNVKILAVDSVTGPALASTYIAYALRNGSNVYFPPNSVFGTQVYGDTRIIDCGEINPLTRLPWSPADIISFDTPGGWEIQVEGNTVSSGNARSTLWKLGLQVTFVTVDNRVAIATWERPGGDVSGDIDMTVRTVPGFTTNWAKPSSGVFSYLARSALAPMIYGTYPIATDVRWLLLHQDLGASGNPAGILVPPVPSMRGYSVGVDQYGIPTEAVDDASNGIGHRAAALSLRTTAPATSDDSQPYFTRGLNEFLLATSTNVIAQRIRTATTNNYLTVRFVVVPPTSGSSTLTVTVNRVSDGVQMGGSFVITAAEARALPEMPAGGKYVQGSLSALAALVSGTQYELRFTASTSDAWVFTGLRTTGGGGSASYGGTTDSARSGGSVLTEQDVVATLLVQPTAPVNARVELHTTQLDPDTLCGTQWRQSAVIRWDSYSALGGSFSHYEIERFVDDGSETWHPIKRVTPESRTSAADHEGPRNRPAKYRIRAVATTAAFSPWAETSFVTPQTPDTPKGDGSVLLVSNAAPDLALVYVHEPAMTFAMDDHDGDTPQRIANRPNVVMFVDPQPRGVGVGYRLVVNFGRQPVDELGRPISNAAVFDPIRRLTRAVGALEDPSIPYVAVLDASGGVTYGFVTLGQATKDMPGWVYKVPAGVVTLSDTPVVVDDAA